jgi:hypothetical protein
LNESAIHPGSAARKAESLKRRKYAELARRYIFEPVAIDTLGVYGETTALFMKDLGRRLTDFTGDRREGAWLQQRMGLAVQRGNAFSILSAGRGEFF